jgi:hypothetical protein
LPFVGLAALGSILAGIAAYLYVRYVSGWEAKPVQDARDRDG